MKDKLTIIKQTIYSLSVVTILFNANLSSQVQQQWVSRYDGPGSGNDTATSIAIDGSGNVYVTGSSLGSGTGPDYATIKYATNGVQQWVQRYNGTGNGYDRATSIALDGSGNIYVTGASLGIGTGTDYTTIKYNSSGAQQWLRRYHGSGTGDDMANSLIIDGSGNVYVTGQSNGNGTGYDYATIKYNSNGDSVWVRRYNGTANGIDNPFAMTIDGSGNIYVTGESQGNGTSYDYLTIKYNSNGDSLWVQRYDGTGHFDAAYAIAVDNSGNVYVTGSSYLPSFHSQYTTVKYNSGGVQQWVQRFNGPLNDFDVGSAIAIDQTGNVYVTGSSTEENSLDFDYGTIKYNSSGVQQWVRFFDGPGNLIDNGNAITLDAAGNIYVTGDSYGSGTNLDYATVKYNSNGDSVWTIRYNGPGNGVDGALAIVVDASENVYITGYSAGSGTNLDYATIKYSQVTGIRQNPSGIPKTFELSQNFPNPFNPSTIINYQLPRSSSVKLIVYDVMGREVKTLVNERQTAGSYQIEFDAGNYPSGVYFYVMKTMDFTDAKRMVLLK
jgi:uncharacterized delta-60 repeat protein